MGSRRISQSHAQATTARNSAKESDWACKSQFGVLRCLPNWRPSRQVWIPTASSAATSVLGTGVCRAKDEAIFERSFLMDTASCFLAHVQRQTFMNELWKFCINKRCGLRFGPISGKPGSRVGSDELHSAGSWLSQSTRNLTCVFWHMYRDRRS